MIIPGGFPCLLCQNESLTFLRRPLGTRRGALVYVCDRCGLMQSRYERAEEDGVLLRVHARGDGVARPSCLSDYGNLRTGKLGRARHALDAIDSFSAAPPKIVLDVGASRGEFVMVLTDRHQECSVTGIEPDLGMADWAFDLGTRRIGLDTCRVEDFFFPKWNYDWIVMIHTLEHLDDPVRQLKRLGGALAPGGLVYVEVPDVGALLARDDVVEELFLDKHVMHFSWQTFQAILAVAGLKANRLESDGENLWAVCSRPEQLDGPLYFSGYSGKVMTSVKKYDKILGKNTARMIGNMPRLNERLSRGRAVAWGAGRILDALRRSTLDMAALEAVVDSRSPLDEFHGVPVVRPGMLAEVAPASVLVCSRSSASEIAAEAAQLVPGTEIIFWNESLKIERS